MLLLEGWGDRWADFKVADSNREQKRTGPIGFSGP